MPGKKGLLVMGPPRAAGLILSSIIYSNTSKTKQVIVGQGLDKIVTEWIKARNLAWCNYITN